VVVVAVVGGVVEVGVVSGGPKMVYESEVEYATKI
jgi:hypothetical protein